MISKEIMHYSLRNLWHNKGRSSLTILSIFIGIVTIFIFVSFGWGLYDYIEEVTASGTADKIIIQQKGIATPGLDDSFYFTESDLRSVEKTTGIYEVSGVGFKPAKITQGKEIKYVFLIAYNPKEPLIMDIFGVNIDRGRNLRPGDGRKVVLGSNYLLEDKIFSRNYELNDEIKIQENKLKVIGFFETIGNPQDDSNIYVTLDYKKEIYNEDEITYDWIIASVDTSNIENIISNVEDSVRNSRDLKEGEEDFFVQSYQEMIDTYSNILDIIIGFVILIALISVLVSAINTANTMITSVLERIQEIGIIKSIGARNSEIFKLFLFESSVLGFIAGFLGIVFGFILTFIGGKILQNFGWSFLQPHYSIYLFIGCILFAIITGAISGVVPAVNASKTNPVEALRYE
ncbi:MAG: ABC transporter permease [Nanoarchaeota archaeon]